MEVKRCGSIGRKINKNAKEFNMLDAYGKMTPIQIQGAIQTALAAQKRELVNQFEIEYAKMREEYNRNLRINFTNITDIVSVELLYELANQMKYWDLKVETEEDEFVRDSIKFRVREMFENTMAKINAYADMKYEAIASKEFEKRKKTIQREFGIKF